MGIIRYRQREGREKKLLRPKQSLRERHEELQCTVLPSEKSKKEKAGSRDVTYYRASGKWRRKKKRSRCGCCRIETTKKIKA